MKKLTTEQRHQNALAIGRRWYRNHKATKGRRRYLWGKKNPQKLLFYAIKRRAKNKKLPFDIKVEDLVIPKFCPVLGIPLKFGGRFSPNLPTVDRVIPEKGYVKSNIQIISWRANRLKCDATLAELEAIINYVRKHTKTFGAQSST